MWCDEVVLVVAVVPWVVVVVGVGVVTAVVVKVVVGGCAGNGVVQVCLATELGLWRRPPVRLPSLSAGRCAVVVGGGGLVGLGTEGVVLVGALVGGGVDAACFAFAGRDLEPFGGGWSIRLAALRCSSTSSLRAVASDFTLGALASVGGGPLGVDGSPAKPWLHEVADAPCASNSHARHQRRRSCMSACQGVLGRYVAWCPP